MKPAVRNLEFGIEKRRHAARVVVGLLALATLNTHCGSDSEPRRRRRSEGGQGGQMGGTAGCGGSCAGKAGGAGKGGSLGGAGSAGLGGTGPAGSAGAGTAGSGGSGSGGELSKAGSAGVAGSGGSGGSAGEEASAGDGGAGVANESILTITKVALYQATEVTLFEDGVSVEPNAPIVADRAAQLRVFLQRGSDFSPRDVVGAVTFTGKRGAQSQTVTEAVAGDSTSGSLASTLNFTLSELDLGEANTLRVELREADGDEAVLDSWPRSGAAEVPGSTTHGPLHVTLVPLVSGGFTPDLSTAAVELFQSHLEALYPITGAAIRVHDPVTLATPVLGDDYGTGWEEALDALYSLRAEEEPAANEYYYGVLTPGRDMDDYCPVSCVVGLSVLAGAGEEEYRGAIGTGFFEFEGDTFSQETLEHELGHALGRDHAPCDTQDADRNFPYSDGSIGVWGWDGARLRSPAQDADVMSYCIPVWVSDYTFDALFRRIAYVNGLVARSADRSQTAPKRARTLVLKSDGSARWGSERPTRRSFDDARERVELLDAAGNVLAYAPGRLARFDHLPGGFLSVPVEALAQPGVVAVRAHGATIAVP